MRGKLFFYNSRQEGIGRSSRMRVNIIVCTQEAANLVDRMRVNRASIQVAALVIGRSPRMRGKLSHVVAAFRRQGSIPAHAGKPHVRLLGGFVEVDPSHAG